MSTFIHAKQKGSDELLPIWNCKEDDVESFWRKPRHRILLRLQKLIFCERGYRSDSSVAFTLHQLLLRRCWIQILRKPLVFEFGIKFRGGNSQKVEHKTWNCRLSIARKSNLAKPLSLSSPFPWRHYIYMVKKKVKLSPKQALEAYRVVRCYGSHIV
jgi:hypothetical protein